MHFMYVHLVHKITFTISVYINEQLFQPVLLVHIALHWFSWCIRGIAAEGLLEGGL